jgi:hypothetical protein
MTDAAILPIDLGCCPAGSGRCALCAPTRPPEPASIAHFVAAAREDGPVQVSFLGGRPPDEAEVAALSGAAFTARVRPDALSRTGLAQLVDAGCRAVELDACSLGDHGLRRSGRLYRGARVLEMLAGIRAAGVETGVVLAPGLPGTDAEILLDDAKRVAPLTDTARIHPVLVRSRSQLARWYGDGLYRPLPLEDAVVICRDLLDVLEGAGVRVLRIGLQPREAPGRVLAGPVHPSLRELVESSRALDRLRVSLGDSSPGDDVEIRCARPDEARTRGPYNQNLTVLRREFALGSLRVVGDDALHRGEVRVIRGGGRA